MAEKNLSEIPRSVREKFDRGMAAYHKENLDYAIALFQSALEEEPGFFECREALRAAQFRRRGSGATPMLRRLLSQASPALAKAQFAARTNPVDALRYAEQILNEDPSNRAAHEVLAKSAMAAGFPKTAVLSLEIILKQNAGDRGISIKLAEALVATGQTGRADKIYADLLAANPGDIEVAQAYKNLGAVRTLKDKGYASIAEGRGTYRDALRDPAEAASLENASRHAGPVESVDKALSDFAAQVAREPENKKLVRSLAELHARKGDHQRALDLYLQVAAAEGHSDPEVEKVISQLRLKLMDQRLASLDPSLLDYDERRAAIASERDVYALEECQARARKYPTDPAIRFELGRLHFERGNWSKAIEELQRAQIHPQHRISALGLMAKCFARRGILDLAIRALQNAIKEKPVLDAEKKDLIYELALIFEKAGRAEDAVEQFKIIYEADIGFRDVAARVDAFYDSQSRV
ncbi:MAG: tetratricopeptide repeat protein [Verrucomicrobiales bacterium]|nr:tetratricopeptide repeat protein [Verrucomicrobiales bacterium]